MNGWQTAGVVALVTVVVIVLGIRLLLRGRRVPAKAKLVIAGAVVWLLSPLDPLPEVLGPIGLLDDIAVLIAAVRYVLDQLDPQPEYPEQQPAPPTQQPASQRVRDRRAIDPQGWRVRDDPPDRR